MQSICLPRTNIEILKSLDRISALQDELLASNNLYVLNSSKARGSGMVAGVPELYLLLWVTPSIWVDTHCP